MATVKIAGEDALRQNVQETKDYVDSQKQNKVCPTQAEWESLTDAEKNNPNTYWYLPWMDGDLFARDRTPIGTVIGVTGDYTTLHTAGTTKFPTDDYLICDGSVVNISDYPKLSAYFKEVYGANNYFGGDGTTTIAAPEFTTDFPTNGLLCIKAQMGSTNITFAEIDDEKTASTEIVRSASYVSNIEEYIYHMNRRTRKNITSDIQSDKGARLIAAIAEQDLAKYGYTIGDYFESPTNRTLYQQSSNASTETAVSVKIRYHLADPDTYYADFNQYALISTHHLGIVVDTMVMRQYHTEALTDVGYNGSTLQAFLQGTGTGQLMAAINADITALFGSNRLLSHQKLFTTKMSAWAWQTEKYISALTESQVYGHTVWSLDAYQEGEAVNQLELFQKFRWNEIFGYTWTWLRNLLSASSACIAHYDGRANGHGVTNALRASGLILLH